MTLLGADRGNIMMDEVKMTLSIKSSSKLLSDAHAAPSDRRAQRLPLAWRLSKSAEVASWDNCCDDVGNKYSGQLGPAVSRQTATSLQGGKFCGVWAQYENRTGGRKEKKKSVCCCCFVILSSGRCTSRCSTVHTYFFLVVMLENAAGNSRYN